ncbi:MAG: alkaline phosphatase family protein [Pseudomonadales bacterium]|nr:alkaline phosphatase family protein [Pseudomonadales bacterium]
MRTRLRLVVLLAALWLDAPAVAAQAPALAVVIAIDQLTNERLTDALSGGLGRLVHNGRRFMNSSLDHGLTNTCPGHASLITGMQPGRAGIPGNTYVDRENWRTRYCVEDDDPAHRVLGGTDGRSPGLLKVDGLGDWLKAADPARRVFSVGGKDRSSIMMGGRAPDGAYWFDADQAVFTTSGYYTREMPAYLKAFNSTLAGRLPARWEHAAGSHRVDDFPGESEENGRVSGHPLAAGEEAGRQISQSPYLDEITLDLAQALVVSEQLGSGDSLDLLAVSLSATDTVGHLYGPFSAEAEDALRRLDFRLGEFLDFLDRRIGSDRYVVALSSDHGITELPEWTLARGVNRCPVPGSRMSIWRLLAGVYGRIYWRHTFPFDAPTELVQFGDGQVYVNPAYVAQENLDAEAVLASLIEILESTPGVMKAWTLAELEKSQDEVARLLHNSVVPGVSGDLFLQLHPDCIIGDEGTTHGSVYAQDRSVPVLFYGAGVSAGKDLTPAHSIDLAPTLADLLGIETPAGLDGRVLELNP